MESHQKPLWSFTGYNGLKESDETKTIVDIGQAMAPV